MSEEIMELANVAAESIMKLTKENEALAPMIKKLQEENEKLKNDLRLCGKGLIPKDLIQRGIVEELKKENEKLKEDLKDVRGMWVKSRDYGTKLEDEVKGLREKLDIGTEQRFEEIEKINEKYQNLKEQNEDLKSQIPDKKGKKLSQKDKQLLKDILWDMAALDGDAGTEPVQEENPERVAQFNLLRRLMK